MSVATQRHKNSIVLVVERLTLPADGHSDQQHGTPGNVPDSPTTRFEVYQRQISWSRLTGGDLSKIVPLDDELMMKADSSREPLKKASNAGSNDKPLIDSPIHMPPPAYDDGYDDSIHSDDASSQADTADCIHEDWHEERQTRETWDGKLDFILSCIGYAVGLGNVWRFPYLCYTNGGGAFLVPYFTFLILCGLPMTVLELSIGQFASLGPTALYQKFCPLFQGLGWTQCLISGVCCVYYNVIIAWTLYYFWLSIKALTLNIFSSQHHSLPWADCDNWWNTDKCVQNLQQLKALKQLANTSLSANLTAAELAALGGNETSTGLVKLVLNSTVNISDVQFTTASEEFWKEYILRLSKGIDHPEQVRPELALALAVAWLLIFACLFKGVKSSGRVVYVTATFPYVVLIILCFRGITLPGAWGGIYYYFVPEWSKLLELKVWIAAASQIFYSVGAAWGVMITFASFNKFNHNCYRDAMILPIINCMSSIFAGIVVFSIIGFMAYKSGQEVGDVIKSGAGLAFVVYPEAVVSMPFSPVWSCLFFTMLLTIGVDSQFGMFETFITAFVDTWPKLLRPRKTLFTAFVCVIMFLLAIPCVTQGGVYVLTLMDWYSATFALMITGTIECLLVGWVYGHERFMADIQLMSRRTVHPWWPFCWRYVTPVVVAALLLATSIGHVAVTYADYEYPSGAIAAGWTLAMLAILPIPFYIVLNFIRTPGTMSERLDAVLRPTPDWGPSRLADRVRFRKSMNTVPGRQLYVLGVERQETQLLELAATNRTSCLDLPKFVEDVHMHGEEIDSPTITRHPLPGSRRNSQKEKKGHHHHHNKPADNGNVNKV